MNALFSIGAVQVLIMLVAVARAKVLAQVLGVEAFGIVGAIDQTAISVMQLGALSLPFTALKFLSARHSEGHDAFQREFTTFLRGIVVLGVTAAVVACAVLWWWPDFLGDELQPHRRLFFLAFLGVPAAMLNILFMHTLAAAQRGTASAVVNLIALASLAAAAITGATLAGLGGVYAGALAGGLIGIAGTWVYLRRALGIRYARPEHGVIAELRANRDVARYAMFLYAALAAYSVTMVSTRYIVINHSGPVGAGLLQSLLGVSMSVGAVLLAMTNLSFAPRVNRKAASADKVRAANEFGGQVCVLFTAGALGIALFPSVTLTVLYSSEFLPAAPILVTFLLWQCAFTIAQVAFQLLIGLDDVVFYAIITSGTYIVAVAVFPSFVERFGLAGVAYALGAATLLGIAAVAARVRIRFGERFGRGLFVRFAGCLAIIASAAFVFSADSEFTLLGIAGRFAYATAAGGLLWITLRAEERRALVGAFDALRKPAQP